MKTIFDQITTTFTVWCSNCSEWEYAEATCHNKSEAIEDYKKRGWKFNKNIGWLCKKCQEKINK
jgi:ABC-type transporter lipoprotein component MlaA